MTINKDILKPFEVIERQTLEVVNVVEKNKYFTILFFSQLYTQLDTCHNFHPDTFILLCRTHIVAKNRESNSRRTVARKITFNTWLTSHFAKVLLSEEVGQLID